MVVEEFWGSGVFFFKKSGMSFFLLV
eukprot:SAG31_NODE_2669_length_5271_cov_4.901199_1_plen_25_part_10